MKKKTGKFNLILGCILLGGIGLFALSGLLFMPYDPEGMDIANKLAAPSLAHPFGCDNFGRDIFSRVQSGLLTTLGIGISSVALGTVLGTLLGALMGYYAGLIDEGLMRIMDVLFAIPSILLALIFLSVFDSSMGNVILALGFSIVPSFAKMMRQEFRKQREMEYVKVAKLFGASDARILFVHILPNVMPTFINCILISFNNAVLAEAGMSYLGIGVQPPKASLGRMLSEAQGYLTSAPFYTIFPGIIMILMLFGFCLLSEKGSEKNA
ncbi:MAG: ABC transporter permease [Lachnospiraceae bacterium]|nr:ABC transporter permease [Lachnospiraceae bacterium]